MTVTLPITKIQDIIYQCKRTLREKCITIREFAQIIGKLVATEPGVQYAPLFYKPLEIQKDLELKINRGNFDKTMLLTAESKECLLWWINNVKEAFRPILIPKPDRIIESDSSLLNFNRIWGC